MKTDEKTYKFNEGVMWEDNPWSLVIDYECSEYDGKPCKHCYDFKNTIDKDDVDDEEKYDIINEVTWICPKVIIVDNEGGYNSTGLCLDCLLESIKSI